MSIKDVLASVKKSFQFHKEVTIKGNRYEVSVLTMGQEKKVNAHLEAINQDDSLEYLNDLRVSVLSESITAVNGEHIDTVVKDVDKDGKDVEKDKAIYVREFLTELPATVITELFDSYVDVKEQSDDILKKEMKYDWFKTPEQRAKEAEEETKKAEEAAKKAAAGAAKEEKKEEAAIPDVKLTKVAEVKTEEAPK